MKHIYLQNLKTHLTNSVKGKVKITVKDDTAIVTIINKKLAIDYAYKVHDLTETIVSGYPSSMLANAIIKCYKNYILNQIFVK